MISPSYLREALSSVLGEFHLVQPTNLLSLSTNDVGSLASSRELLESSVDEMSSLDDVRTMNDLNELSKSKARQILLSEAEKIIDESDMVFPKKGDMIDIVWPNGKRKVCPNADPAVYVHQKSLSVTFTWTICKTSKETMYLVFKVDCDSRDISQSLLLNGYLEPVEMCCEKQNLVVDS